MFYVRKNSQLISGIAFKTKAKAVAAIISAVRAEGGVTEFAEYNGGKGAWVCSPENQYDIRKHNAL